MGSVSSYKLKGGQTRYRVRYRTPEHGQTDKRGFRTKREAEAWDAQNRVSLARGEYVAPSLGRVTVGELGPAWLERQRGHMKPSGYRSYESAWRVHVQPRWAQARVGRIRYTDVQGWVAELSRSLSASRITTVYSVLACILDDAVRDRVLASNPARGVNLPRRVKRPDVYLTAEQLRVLADESGRYGSLVLLLGTAGLRWGEAAALRVGDIDFLHRRVLLHQNAVQVGGETHVGSLKSGRHRTVGLSGFVVKALAKTCRGKAHGDLIWPARDGDYLGPPSSVRSWLSGAVERCQKTAEAARAKESVGDREPTTPLFPRITAHDLRHTAASLAVSAGANVKVVQRMLGHASAAMTLDVYADLFDDDLNGVAQKLDETVGKMWAQSADSTA